MYRAHSFALAAVMLALAALPAAAQDSQALVRMPSRHFDRVSALPGDFRSFGQIVLEPATATFSSEWLKDINSNRIALLRGTTAKDADDIAGEVAKGLNGALARALRDGGFVIVAQPGPGVVTLSPRIENLYINAPRTLTTASPGRVYTGNAGRAKFDLDVRDSITGRLLVHVDDERIIGVRPNLRLATPPSNTFDFAVTFDEWTRGTVATLDALRKVPVAAVTSRQR